MRQPLLSGRAQQRAGVAAVVSLPAPVRGWNTRDPIAQMNQLYAVELENCFPSEGEIQLRGGAETWATGGASAVKTLISFAKNSGTKNLFACTDSGIYSATAGGAMGATVAALTNGLFEHVVLTNSAGTNFVWGCNGTDKVLTYDGTTWLSLDGASTPAITGPTTTNLNWCWLHMRRIWAIEKNSMKAWYGPIDSIAGEFRPFPLGALFKRGGYLLSGATWTIDAGAGADDYCAFVTSEGELAVYHGTNPGSASSWSLAGVYFVGRPPNRRCFAQYGGDLVIATEFGLLSLAQLLQAGLLSVDKALTSSIRPTFATVVREYGTVSGWQVMLFPTRNALIVNTPVTAERSYQFVMNTVTGAWCSFSGWPALCFVVHDGQLYFGQEDGTVALAWDGELTSDFGADITGTALQAYTRFGRSAHKQIVMIRPLVSTDGTVQLGFGLSADFDNPRITSTVPRGLYTPLPLWDVNLWDVTLWGTTLDRKKRWHHVSSEPGYTQAFFLQLVSQNATIVSWSGTDFQVV